MEIDIYKKIFENKHYVYIPFDSNELIIILSTFGMGNRYMQLKSLFENQKTNLLFLTDSNYTWYLESDGGESYKRLLDLYIKKFNKENITILGSSMSGFSALFFGFCFEINIITSNPQITLDDITKHIKKNNVDKNKFIELNTIINNKKSESCIYYIHGKANMDMDGLNNFFKLKPKNIKYIIETVDIDIHTYFLENVNDIYDRVTILKHLRKLNNSIVKVVSSNEI